MNTRKLNKLAEKTSSSRGSSYSYYSGGSHYGYGYGYGYGSYYSHHSDGFGLGGLVLGLCMIPFAFACLWKNEKK